jgi:hypothetical protein
MKTHEGIEVQLHVFPTSAPDGGELSSFTLRGGASGLIENVKKNIFVRFEVFTAVTMKKAVFSNLAPCRNFVNRPLG